MTKFETAKTYSTRSIGDADCIFSFKIIKRTAKTVTILDLNRNEVRRGIKIDDSGREWIFPLGQYSMAPVISA